MHPWYKQLLVCLGALLFAVACWGEQPRQSKSDERDYRHLVLANGLKVLLISDKNVHKAAASLSVAVGSNADPKDHQGMAHLLEHMLFLGTRQYPEPDSFTAFINEYGGSNNAYTSFDETNYFFDIQPRYLDEALARFASFFYEALIDPQYLEREEKVVDAEFQARFSSDGRRIFAAVKQMVNPEHPYAKFSIGNLDSLSRGDQQQLRAALVDLYKRYYRAGSMALVVQGQESLDDLAQMVEKHFSSLVAGRAPTLTTDKPLFLKRNLANWLQVVPLTDTRRLMLVFPIDGVGKDYRNKPARFLAHFIGHEGQGSLLSNLKEQSLAYGLQAGVSLINQRQSLFFIQIDLTTLGAEQREEVARQVFQYLKLLQGAPPPAWHYNEQSLISELQFRYSERLPAINYVSAISAGMHHYASKDYLIGPYLYEHYDRQKVTKYANALVASNCLFVFVAPEVQTKYHTPWFKTPYNVTRINSKTLKLWQRGTVSSVFHLPEPNPYLPENIEIFTGKNDMPPLQLLDTPSLRLWFKQDVEFNTPRSVFTFRINSSHASKDFRQQAYTHLMVALLNDELVEKSYPADLVGMQLEVIPTLRGLEASLSGFTSGQKVLLQHLITKLTDLTIDEKRFQRILAGVQESWRNQSNDMPYRRTIDGVYQVMFRNYWDDEAKLVALKDMTAADLARFKRLFLRDVSIDALAYGSLRKPQAIELTNVLQQGLRRSLASRATTFLPLEVLSLPEGSAVHWHVKGKHLDSGYLHYSFTPTASLQNKAMALLTKQIISNDLFHDLRTEKQIGYVVFAHMLSAYKVPGVALVLQSPHYSPTQLRTFVYDFLNRSVTRYRDMPTEKFETHLQQGLVDTLKLPAQNYLEQAELYWEDIKHAHFNFDSRQRLIDIAESLQFEQWYQWYIELAQQNHPTVNISATSATSADFIPPSATPVALVPEITLPEVQDIKDLSYFRGTATYEELP